MPKKKQPKIATSKANIDSYKHKDKRKNIPTQELSHYTSRDVPPKTIYKYDPSLDPQLVWAGKEEHQKINVDSVPLYIQEKVSPEAIINRLKNDDESGGSQLDLFGESADRVFEDMVDFYHHDDNWTNRMILGDSLEVMNSLIEKEGMRGKVQCVYIDPPYGVKFGSNWQVSTKKKVVKDGMDDNYTRQPEQIKAFRDTWEIGVHSYLTYLRDRLLLTRDLMTESGSCFVQISDENVHLVRSLMDEIFGSENFISQIRFFRAGAQTSKFVADSGDYILWYARNKIKTKFRNLYVDDGGWVERSAQKYFEFPDGKIISAKKINKIDTGGAKIFTTNKLESASYSDAAQFDVEFDGRIFQPKRGWSTNSQGIERLRTANRLIATGNTLRWKVYADDFPLSIINNNWLDTSIGFGAEDKIYVVQTTQKVIKRCLLMTSDPGDIVLDPTCGSGSTAYVAEQWGRRWITIDTSRVALALARTRLMTAKFPYYKLRNRQNIREGFEYKIVPHVSLKSLVNDLPPTGELLFDQAKENKDVIRVSGPFTVESLSPHRVSDLNEILSSKDFVHKVIDNLSKFGYQTGIKNERLEFDNLDLITDQEGALQARGEYKENEEVKQAAVAIGPEYGSVDDDMVRASVKQASKYYDLLIVAGTSFEGSAFTEDKNPFGIRVVKVKINPDLSMGDLLKKTGSGNLFLAFGEPDIQLHEEKEGNKSVEIKGVDVYDATKGIIRSGDSNEIACWFIDTNYNDEAFFVTHAYFTGVDKPFEKLKKALRAEIDEEAWETLYTTRSRPFSVPETGKIAVKVINHYGDEVMKIIEVS
ncbi:site-specific DNA-methyltransferase [Patescibacteria group bacterium]